MHFTSSKEHRGEIIIEDKEGFNVTVKFKNDGHLIIRGELMGQSFCPYFEKNCMSGPRLSPEIHTSNRD